jgi:pantoate kinase
MAFCPGHITGFFQICKHDDVLKTGSRGAGFSITAGAESRVVLEEGDGKIDVFVNKAHAKARVTEMTMLKLLEGEKYDAKVYTSLQLPMAQGFGMSAAGALATALALTDLLGKGVDEAYQAAHEAEVTCGTGLGDIAALKQGGFEFRTKEGLQPNGEVIGLEGDMKMLLCKVGPTIDTSTVLKDPVKTAAIIEAGKKCVASFKKDMSIENFFELSHEFSEASGLMTDKVRAALDIMTKDDRAAMCMVGNSVFATGPDLPLMERKLAKFGTVYETKVDHRGPRLM